MHSALSTYPEAFDVSADEIVRAARELDAGRLVVMPTETVYGLAGNAANDSAVAEIYQLKGRPSNNPLILHVSGSEMVKEYAQMNANAEQLMQCFWPGALTIVLKRLKGANVSDLASAGGDSIALRAPAHPVAMALIEQFEKGIVAPSANRSGKISPTSLLHVKEEFGDKTPFTLDGGECQVGLESTVVDARGERLKILRPGAVTAQQIEEKTGLIIESAESTTANSELPLAAPGLLSSHYAPTLPVRLNAVDVQPNEHLLAFGKNALSGAKKILNLSEKGNLEEAAMNLFGMLRALDGASGKEGSAQRIAVMPIPEEGIGIAINDRLRRAAADRN